MLLLLSLSLSFDGRFGSFDLKGRPTSGSRSEDGVSRGITTYTGDIGRHDDGTQGIVEEVLGIVVVAVDDWKENRRGGVWTD